MEVKRIRLGEGEKREHKETRGRYGEMDKMK